MLSTQHSFLNPAERDNFFFFFIFDRRPRLNYTIFTSHNTNNSLGIWPQCANNSCSEFLRETICRTVLLKFENFFNLSIFPQSLSRNSKLPLTACMFYFIGEYFNLTILEEMSGSRKWTLRGNIARRI